MQKRRFHRVTFHAPGELKHHEMSYKCRLENISLRGALISADECIMVPLGETCTFAIWPDREERPMVISVIIVHSFFSMVGVQFVGFTDDAETRLLELMKRTSPEPEMLSHEWDSILAQKARQEEKPQEKGVQPPAGC